MNWFSFACALIFCWLVPGTAIAETAARPIGSSVGRVITRSSVGIGRVLIEAHQLKARYEAKRVQFLYPADEVVVSGGATAEIQFHEGRAITLPNRLDGNRFTVPEDGKPSAVLPRNYLDQNLSWLRDRDRIAVQRATLPMDQSQSSLAAAPLLPEGEQFWSGSTRMLALVWNGYAAFLDVAHARCTPPCRYAVGSLVASIVDDGEAVPNLQTGAVRVTLISPANARLTWTLVPNPAVPLPAWLAPSTDLGDEEQLAWALWLLLEAGPSWRLEAMARIAELSRRYFIAEVLWNSIEAGNDSVLRPR
jgi:hypothetical protein